MIRDIIPFLLLFLPLTALPILRKNTSYFRALIMSVMLIGLLFSLRSLSMHFSIACYFKCEDKNLYLENMPTVLFSALYLLGHALKRIERGLTVKNSAIGLSLIALSLLPITAMALTSQRASLGAVCLYVCIVQGMIIYKSPARSLTISIIGGICAGLLNISIYHILQTLWQKNQVVGLNMRPQEMQAVWHAVSEHPLIFIFGTGWGSAFHNPAVGNLYVNFTHNFFSSMLLKTGIIGALLALAYILGLLERLGRVSIKDPTLGLAICAPILIDLTLYASFKSFDFGLMLLMISASLIYVRQCTTDQKS